MDPVKFCDVMVDIETTGTSPDRANILQIAAVRFDPYKKEVDQNFFYKNLVPRPDRFWDEDTRSWWSEQDPRVWDAVTVNPEKPESVMRAFADWAGYRNAEPLRFWAKPTSFDFTFVASYFKDYGITNPFHFRNAIDLNSFIRGRANTTQLLDLNIPFEGDAHNGIFDCLHQIKLAFAATSIKGDHE